MRQTLLLLAILISGTALLAQDITFNSTCNDDRRSIRYSDSFTDYDVQVKGDVSVNDDDTRITAITPGGYLKISKKTFGNRRAIIIESDSKGSLTYEYYEGRKEVPYDPEGKKWLADVLLEVVRISGIAAEDRTKRIYNKGGIDAFLEEIHMIESNTVMGAYFSALFDQFKLNENETMAACEAIGSEISSNTERGSLLRKYSDQFMQSNATMVVYFKSISKLSSNTERGSVLRKISKEINFNDPKVISAYFGCVDGMSSNTERGSVLRNLEKTQDLSEGAYVRLLQSVKHFSSNTEMGSVMRSLENLNMQNPEIATEFFNTVNSMSSNTEAGLTLRHILKRHELSDKNMLKLLQSVKHLTSNTETDAVMTSIRKINLSNEQVNTSYFNMINMMTSNTSAGSVLRYTVKNHNMPNNAWKSYFSVAGHLTSNTEMGSVLRAAIPAMPHDQAVLDAFLQAPACLPATPNTVWYCAPW
ncbi:MAG: hypothetical protein R2759_18475 [Bacteroidales bacterium]